MKTDFERYVEACNYPGLLDEKAVARHLADYLSALGVKRKIVRLAAGWTLEDHPSLRRNIDAILDDFGKRNLHARDDQAARDVQDALDVQATLNARDAMDALDDQDALDARDAQAAQAARAAQVALDAQAARAAHDSLAALGVLDALAIRSAQDALTNIDRFAAWCVQYGSYYWYDWELSWIVVTALGARELKKPKVEAWATPLLEAFIAGAWFLYWTDDTLYWVAKPVVHMDPTPNTWRLHNDKYAAIESDAENLYFWHGVMVPAFVVVQPEWITLKHIEDEQNAEVRRVMIERYDEARWVVDSGMKPVAKDRFGELFVQSMAAGRPVALVRVKNATAEPDGSFKTYFLPVNPAHYDGDAGRYPQAAVASTWRTTRGGKELAFKNWRDYDPITET